MFHLNNLKHSVQAHQCFRAGQDLAFKITSTNLIRNNSKTNNFKDEVKTMITFVSFAIYKYMQKVSFHNPCWMSIKVAMI